MSVNDQPAIASVEEATSKVVAEMGELGGMGRVRAALAVRLARIIDETEDIPPGALIKEFRGLLTDLEPAAPAIATNPETGTVDDEWTDLGTPG